MLSAILEIMGFQKPDARIGGPALSGTKSTRTWMIYSEADRWYFSWRTEDHNGGAVKGPFWTREEAELEHDQTVDRSRNIIWVEQR